VEDVTASGELPAALVVPESVEADHAFISFYGAVLPGGLLPSEVGEGVEVCGGEPRRRGVGGKRSAAVALAVGGEGQVEEQQTGGGEAEEEEEEGGEEDHYDGLQEERQEFRVCF
jgi:hypothetical protein